MTLTLLLDKCCISHWNRAEWFSSSKLVLSTLLVADKDDHGGIERQFSARLREFMPDLVITFAPNSAQVIAKAQTTRPSAFKKGYRPDPPQGDLY